MTVDADLLAAFRVRLASLIGSEHGQRSVWAKELGIDRTTLTQLLSSSNRRMPRAETLIAIARHGRVSVDWLLGLQSTDPTTDDTSEAAVPHYPVIERDAGSADDARLLKWRIEASGSKIRYVPSTLPDLLKTEEVMRYERIGTPAGTLQRDRVAASGTLTWQRRPDADMECCSSLQSLEGFASGHGVWARLPVRSRRAQLEHMADLADELYPTFRWFLYDGRSRYAAPVTIFGVGRAALYVGQMYLVFTTEEHVVALAQHFDSLLRVATVQPPDIPSLCRRLARSAI
jgi:transcriptional regulator with XRE-family HTH domain